VSKKKNKKKNIEPSQPKAQSSVTNQSTSQVRLSQCMIVKNEEKHIERALGWAKDIAYEQIVVDTGSTDRTVELAKQQGAKVYHFEWINDFSAAKNFAMDKAEGNWIAILDADEYMIPEDAEELKNILDKIQSDPATAKQYDAIDNSWAQLDDNYNIFAVLTNRRVFRNSPELRYKGKIHEAIWIINKSYDATHLKIMHTGYAQSVYNETDKRARNLKLLRDEYERDPKNPNIMIYLADSIKAEGTEEARKEAEELFLKAIKNDIVADAPIKQLAYDFLIPRFSRNEQITGGISKKDEALKLCDQAITDLPENIDYYYFRAILNNQKGNFESARDDLTVCERAFTKGESIPATRVLLSNPMSLFFQQKIAAKGTGDEQGLLKSTTVLNSMLNEAKTNISKTGSYILNILLYGLTEDEALDEFAGVHDFNDPKELMFLARAAKESGAISFSRRVLNIVEALMK